MKKSKYLVIMLAFIILFVNVPSRVTATMQEDESVQPIFDYIFSADNSLTISDVGEGSISTGMLCVGSVTKCEIKVVLQRKVNGVFTPYKTWTHVDNCSFTFFDTTHYVTRGTWRTVSTFTAYEGSHKETVTITGRDVVF